MSEHRSSYRELSQVFQNGIPASTIAEPLVSFDGTDSGPRAKNLMDKKGFDIAGVRDGAQITGYVDRESIGEGPVSLSRKDFHAEQILPDSSSLLDVINALGKNQWVVIEFLGNPSGIVTLGDLGKHPARLWMFGLISILEMHLTQMIRHHKRRPGWWKRHLTEQRVSKCLNLFEWRKRDNEETDIIDCLQITDKRIIFRSESQLLRKTGISDSYEWESIMKEVEKLRNTLAHSSDGGFQSWQDSIKTVQDIERVISEFESATD